MHTYDSCKHMLLDHSDLAPRPCGRRKVAILLMLAFMHHPYLVCTYTFGMPSLHLLKFLMFFLFYFLVYSEVIIILHAVLTES